MTFLRRTWVAPEWQPGVGFKTGRMPECGPHRLLRKRGVETVIARRGVTHGSGMGRVRWAVEHAFAWLHQFKQLRIRYERRADLHRGRARIGLQSRAP